MRLGLTIPFHDVPIDELGPLEAAADRLAAFAEAGITTAVIALLVLPSQLEPAIEVLARGRP